MKSYQEFEINPLSEEDRVYASFLVILKSGVNPAQFSSAIGIEPDFGWRQGEKFTLWGKPHLRPDTVWGLESLQVEANVLDDHLRYIIDRLNSAKDFQLFRSNEVIEVHLRIQRVGFVGIEGITISDTVLLEISKFCGTLLIFF